MDVLYQHLGHGCAGRHRRARLGDCGRYQAAERVSGDHRRLIEPLDHCPRLRFDRLASERVKRERGAVATEQRDHALPDAVRACETMQQHHAFTAAEIARVIGLHRPRSIAHQQSHRALMSRRPRETGSLP